MESCTIDHEKQSAVPVGDTSGEKSNPVKVQSKLQVQVGKRRTNSRSVTPAKKSNNNKTYDSKGTDVDADGEKDNISKAAASNSQKSKSKVTEGNKDKNKSGVETVSVDSSSASGDSDEPSNQNKISELLQKQRFGEAPPDDDSDNSSTGSTKQDEENTVNSGRTTTVGKKNMNKVVLPSFTRYQIMILLDQENKQSPIQEDENNEKPPCFV